MVRSHYNQKARLKEFSRMEEGKHVLTMVDLKAQKIGKRRIERAFYEKGLYSDELEKELNLKVEAPGMKIFDKIYNSNGLVLLTRSEQEIVRKYLLIQQYRNPSNMSHYDPDWEGDVFHLNQKYIDGDVTYKEDLYQKMRKILDKSWDELIESEDEEIQFNARRTYSTMLLFVRSEHEFVINDLGLVTERQPWDKFSNDEDVKKQFKSKLEGLGAHPADAEFEKYLAEHQYHDNYTFYPISSKHGIITIEFLWVTMMKYKQAYKLIKDNNGELYTVSDPNFFKWMDEYYGLHSDFIKQNFVPCMPNYQSESLNLASSEQELAELLKTHKNPDDLYLYPVIDLNLKWVLYLNSLTINEAVNYFAFGSNLDGRITIDYYEMGRISYSGQGYKHDLNWLNSIDDWTKPLN